MSNYLSIGFRLALESYIPTKDRVDPDREIPISPITIDYNINRLYINLLSLVRNTLSANRGMVLSPKQLAGLVNIEYNNILDYFSKHNVPKPILYRLPYGKILRRFGLTNLVREHTKGSKIAEEFKLIADASNLFRSTVSVDYLDYDKVVDIPIIHTHILLDMLVLDTIKTPILLEGHTGKLRTISSLYQRLLKVGKDPVPPLPFTPITYGIFGDRLIKPSPIKLRK